MRGRGRRSEKGVGAAGTRIEVHDGSLPPPIPTAGGSFSRGLHSRDHQAFSADRLYRHEKKRREPAASAHGAYGCTPIGGRDGFLMARARNNTADSSDKFVLSFANSQLSEIRRHLIDDAMRLRHFLMRNFTPRQSPHVAISFDDIPSRFFSPRRE